MELFNQPFTAYHDGEATRIVTNVAGPDTTLWKNSEDFSLYLVAEYETESAEFYSIQPPRLIAKVHSILKPIKEAYYNASISNQ